MTARRRLQVKTSERISELPLSPMIDMVFLLLIFFMVTSAFVKERAVQVEQVTAASADVVPQDCIQVVIDAHQRIYVNGEEVLLKTLAGRIGALLAGSENDVAVVVAPDATVSSGMTIRVIDACRLGGATAVALGTAADGR